MIFARVNIFATRDRRVIFYLVCVHNKDDAMFNGDVGTCTMCPNDENMVQNSEFYCSQYYIL